MRDKRDACGAELNARRRELYWLDPDKHRSQIAENARKRVARDRDAYNAYQRASYKNSPHRMREASRKRRAKKANVFTEAFSVEAWRSLVEWHDHRCAYCLKQFDAHKLEVDHVVALARGGEHASDNIVPACEACNTSKNDKALFEIFAPRLLIAQRMATPIAAL
jgi:5-methylcytosine-specific restriction endonuclease McrA